MYTTPRRSPKASPTSSPASAYFNSPNDPSASPSAQLGRDRAGNAGSGVLLTDSPNDAKVDGLPPPAFGVKTRSMKLAEKRIVSGSNLSPKEKESSVRHPESKDGRYDDINEEDDEENDEEEEVVDGLIERMQRNMRIVSSTSTTMARPRMSEVEADEVDGALGQVPGEIGGTQEERSPDQEMSKKQILGTREAALGNEALKSLRQPAIQPRMNKSTLARLNPTTPATRPESPCGDMTTPSRAASRRPASVAVFRPNDIPAKGSASWNVGMETPRRKVQTSDGVEVGNKRSSTVLTPASLRPPAITPRATRASDLRVTKIKDPSYFSPTVDDRSSSRLSGLTKEEIKQREAKIFEGTPGHRRNLSLKHELWSLRPATPHRTNRSADLRRDPTLATLPPTPSREFKARPLPAMYGGGGGGSKRELNTKEATQAGQMDGGSRPKVKA